MKLRLRSLESKETLRLDVPNSCTLRELKEILSLSFSSSPASLHFSLNRKDELQALSSQESLHSLGVTAGDLMYYSSNPMAFVSQTPVQEPMKIEEIGVNSKEPKSQEVVFPVDFQEFEKNEVRGVDSREPLSESCKIEETIFQDTPNALEKEETLEFPGTETMEIDEGSLVMPGKRVTEPYFLNRVLGEKLGDNVGPHGLVIMAVHEILLESSFIGFASVSGMIIDSFDLPDHLLSKGISMSYTLPELLNDSFNDVTEFVALKYQILGHFVNVYGSLAKGDSGLHKLCLNAYKLGPIISLVWANSDKNGSLHDKDEYKSLDCGDEVFEFWKNVKDGLVLPLLIDLCDKAGLSLPACWMHLPTELKLKILECLPGVDVAKMECVSREMRYLTSNNELWKQKFVEEFGGRSDAEGKTSWKDRFVLHWEKRKMRKRKIPLRLLRYVPIIRDPAPFGNPNIQGGDYDRYPVFPLAFEQHHQRLPHLRRLNFSPNCNLGGT